MDWHRIWTLNIDDILENVHKQRRMQYERFNWTSTFRDTSNSERQIIHLHGYAKDIHESDTTDSELVFSTQEYAATLRDTRAWHAVFTDEFAERPFIILGASLMEEFDLQEALSSSAASQIRGFPSVIVLKEVTTFEREEFSELGLIVVESDVRTFMTSLYSEVRKYREKLGGIYGQTYDPSLARFLQQFIDLRQYEPNHNENTRYFYAGYEPHWRNILDEDDAPLEATLQTLSAIRDAENQGNTQQTVHVLTGTPGAGKSTGLLRIGREFVAEGLPTFYFRGDERLDTAAVIHWLERMPTTVLLFDECADFAVAIGELAEECDSSDTQLLVVGAERTSRNAFVERNIDKKYLNYSDKYNYRLLSDDDIDSLIDKLEDRRRLGRITRWSRPRQFNYFRSTASRRLFEGMANLESGQGFRTRIQDDYRRIRTEKLRLLCAVSSIAYQFGYPLPIGTASKVTGLPANKLQDLLTNDGHDLMLLETRGIRTPHRITASLIVEAALSIEERFEALRRLVGALAPHIDVQAITNLTRPYRILRVLMDQASVTRLVGTDYGRRLYELMQESYDWNGRYWEQRALFESELGNHAQARSYAEHSLRIHRHPFAFNTLGTVLGRIALQNGDSETLHEAIKNLQYARDERRWEASEHPYVTFFSTMIRFGQQWGLSAIPTHLRDEFTKWFNQAKRGSVFFKS